MIIKDEYILEIIKISISMIIGILIYVSLTSALPLYLDINGKSTTTSNFITASDSRATAGFDGFDFQSFTNPTNSTSFFSTIVSTSSAIDVWFPERTHEINLTFRQTPTNNLPLNLSWNLPLEDWNVTLHDYWNDSTRTQLNTSISMNLNNSYNISTVSFSNRYFRLNISNLAPRINITFPLNTTYNQTTRPTQLNYTINDSELSSCWYSLDSGITNNTIVCGNNISGLNPGFSSHTWRIYANDTIGSLSQKEVNFTVVPSTFPINIIVHSPTNNSETKENDQIYNMTINTTGITQSKWYSLDYGKNNITFDGDEVVNRPDGSYNVLFCGNLTNGQNNCSSIISYSITGEDTIYKGSGGGAGSGNPIELYNLSIISENKTAYNYSYALRIKTFDKYGSVLDVDKIEIAVLSESSYINQSLIRLAEGYYEQEFNFQSSPNRFISFKITAQEQYFGVEDYFILELYQASKIDIFKEKFISNGEKSIIKLNNFFSNYGKFVLAFILLTLLGVYGYKNKVKLKSFFIEKFLNRKITSEKKY